MRSQRQQEKKGITCLQASHPPSRDVPAWCQYKTFYFLLQKNRLLGVFCTEHLAGTPLPIRPGTPSPAAAGRGAVARLIKPPPQPRCFPTSCPPIYLSKNGTAGNPWCSTSTFHWRISRAFSRHEGNKPPRSPRRRVSEIKINPSSGN